MKTFFVMGIVEQCKEMTVVNDESEKGGKDTWFSLKMGHRHILNQIRGFLL